MPTTDQDRRWLARALRVAESARGHSSPNPPVGCVLVRDGRVVAEAATAPAGGPHAEAGALRLAGDRAAGTTAYVTLEPCAHHGRTPPCADALADAGVARVVVAHPDPSPLAAGGAARLRERGVAVAQVDGPLRAAADEQLAGFLAAIHDARPVLTCKLAQTVDGRLAVPGQRWVTGAAARRAVHRWRAAVDGVLVGVGTVLADDPRLDVRDVPTERQPRPVVLDSRARTPATARAVARGALVLTGPRAPAARVAALQAAGAEVRALSAGADDRVEPAAAARALHEAGMLSVLAEPGATLTAALLGADVVDRLVLHVAGAGPGARFAPAVAVPRRGTGFSPSPGAWEADHGWPPPGWWVERVGGAGADAIVQLRRVTAAGQAAPAPAPATVRSG